MTRPLSSEALVDAVIELGRLALAFGRIDHTACYHPAGDMRESDSDHTVMLGWLAAALADRWFPWLDGGLVAQLALVHNMVEVYAGDTPTLRIDAAGRAAKAERERAAARRLAAEFGKTLPWVPATVLLFEEQREPGGAVRPRPRQVPAEGRPPARRGPRAPGRGDDQHGAGGGVRAAARRHDLLRRRVHRVDGTAGQTGGAHGRARHRATGKQPTSSRRHINEYTARRKMTNPLEASRRLTGLDALAASLEQSLADTARRGKDAAVIAALLRPRPGLYLDRDDTRGDLLVLEDPTGRRTPARSSAWRCQTAGTAGTSAASPAEAR